MVRDGAGEKLTATALIGRIEPLGEAPASFLVDDERQALLDAAHAHGRQTTRAALERRLSVRFDSGVPTSDTEGSDPRVSVGALAGLASDPGLLPVLLDAASTSHRAAGSVASADPGLALVSAELQRPLSLEHRTARGLVDAMAAGWMAIASNPRGMGELIDGLLADLAFAFGAATPRLCFGMRSARGPSEGPSEVPVLAVQLQGSRQLLVQAVEGGLHEQLPLSAGTVVLVPAGCVTTHLPLDADTAHLEIALPDAVDVPVSAARRRANAMRPVVCVDDAEAARVVLDADEGWPMRMRAPGGAQLIAGGREGRCLTIGGNRVDVSERGLDLVEALLAGTYLGPAELASQLDVDPDLVIAGLGRLWAAGLVEPAPAPATLTPNARLTQVATAPLGPQLVAPFVAAARPSAWRTPLVDELHVPAGLDVAVQPIEGTSGMLEAVVDVVAGLNAHFLHLDIRSDPVESALLVRVRPGDSIPASPLLSDLGNDLIGRSTRKLTFVVSLVDADGGWVWLPAGSDTADATPGSVSVWASFRPWTLRPITTGERLLLLGRLHGAAFA